MKEKPKKDLPRRKYKLILSPNYRTTREGVFAFIEENWWESSVDNFHDLLLHKLENLQYFPNGCSYFLGTKYRRFLVWDYLVLFKVNDEKSEVAVYGIYHSSQNLSEMMDELE